MTREFLTKFMRVAKNITDAERCLVVDRELEVIDYEDISEDDLYSKTFQDVVVASIRQAFQTKNTILTNNQIIDPTQAPTTNTNYADLRVVVALPVGQFGALYLDRHIRQGIIPKVVVDQLADLVNYLIDNQLLDTSIEQMQMLYKEQNEADG